MAKNLVLGPNLDLNNLFVDFSSNRCQALYAVSRKTSMPNLRKGQKNKFRARFWPVLAQIWSPKIFFVGFTSTRCYTLLGTIIVRNLKDNINHDNLTMKSMKSTMQLILVITIKMRIRSTSIGTMQPVRNLQMN